MTGRFFWGLFWMFYIHGWVMLLMLTKLNLHIAIILLLGNISNFSPLYWYTFSPFSRMFILTGYKAQSYLWNTLTNLSSDWSELEETYATWPYRPRSSKSHPTHKQHKFLWYFVTNVLQYHFRTYSSWNLQTKNSKYVQQTEFVLQTQDMQSRAYFTLSLHVS